MVRVVLLPAVGTQVQGAMETVGHWQLMAERDVNGVANVSLHVALMI